MTFDGTAFGQPNIGNPSSSGTAPPWKDWGTPAGPGGFQELDMGVQATLVRKGNYNYFDKAIPAGESLGSDTLPASLYLATKPAWFGNLAWPPINPISPGSPDATTIYQKIPAGYRFVNGTNPSGATAGGGGISAPTPTPAPTPAPTPTPSSTATPTPTPSSAATPTLPSIQDLRITAGKRAIGQSCMEPPPWLYRIHRLLRDICAMAREKQCGWHVHKRQHHWPSVGVDYIFSCPGFW